MEYTKHHLQHGITDKELGTIPALIDLMIEDYKKRHNERPTYLVIHPDDMKVIDFLLSPDPVDLYIEDSYRMLKVIRAINVPRGALYCAKVIK